jgi:hypothetical protein
MHESFPVAGISTVLYVPAVGFVPAVAVVSFLVFFAVAVVPAVVVLHSGANKMLAPCSC